MKVYNEDKTEILEDYDVNRGTLQDDILTIHYDKVDGVEEQGHYETIKEYENGGKDVEWIVDVPGVDPVEEHDEYEQIQIYIPYSDEKLAEIDKEIKLKELKTELASTDYEAIKYSEGLYTDEEYEPTKKQRQELRNEINKLQKELDELKGE